MAKPKPIENLKRVNFTLAQSLKQKWLTFSKAYHLTMSQLVRNSVRDYMLKYENLESKIENPEIVMMELKVSEKFGEISDKIDLIYLIMEKMKESEIEDIADMKDQILSIIEDKPKSLNTLHKYTKQPKRLLLDVLKELKGDGLVKLNNLYWGVA